MINIPKNQIRVLTYKQSSGTTYIITKDKYDKYFLYLVDKDNLKKLKTSDNPLDFNECYPERRWNYATEIN